MKTKHTPGPEINWNNGTIDLNDGHGVIAKVYARKTMTNNIEEQKTFLNLFASAPSLLAENKELKEDLDSETKDCVSLSKQNDKIRNINAELLEALKLAKEYIGSPRGLISKGWLEIIIDTAISKAEGGK